MSRKTQAKRSPASPRRRRNLLLLGGLFLVILAVGAWLAGPSLLKSPADATSQSTGSQVALTGKQGGAVGDVVPDFDIPTLDGKRFAINKAHGTPTLLFFMAYWCGTCVPEARALAQIHREYGDSLTIVAVDVDPSSSPKALSQFKEASGNGEYIWAFDEGQRLARALGIRSLDTTLIIDGNGVVVYRDEFPTPYATLKEALNEAGIRS